MGISITITGDKLVNVIGDMEDFINGGHVDLSGADFETETELPVPARRRGRKPKAAAPAAVVPQVVTAAPLPASPGSTAPVAAAPDTLALDASAVAPGGAVFLAVKAYNDKHGMEKARALLLEFGCGMVRQIKPEQYAAVIAKCAE